MSAHWSDRLLALDACEDGITWAATSADPQSAWDRCERPDWMLWLLGIRGDPAAIAEIACRVAESAAHPVGDGGEYWAKLAIAAARAVIADPCERTINAMSEVANDAAWVARYAMGPIPDATRNAIYAAGYAALATWHASSTASDTVLAARAAFAACHAIGVASYAAFGDIIRAVVPRVPDIEEVAR